MPPRLASLLYVATLVAGVVDAISFLSLGHVFVANMTGNVVFIGLAFASAPGISAVRSIVALAAFLAGSAAGGRLARALDRRRRLWLPIAFGSETACFALSLGLLAGGVVGTGGDARLMLVGAMALGMGLQNATAARVALPDITTTVLTSLLTRLVADFELSRPGVRTFLRRLGAVAAMLLGALFGALLVLRVSATAGLVLATALLAAIAAASAAVEEKEGG